MTLRIGDMAACTALLQHGVVGPVPRERGAGNRMFTPREISQGHLIQLLREMGIDKQQLQDYGQSNTLEQTMGLYVKYDGRLANDMTRLQAMLFLP